MERIGNEVERELARGGSDATLPITRVTAIWPTAVGDTVARHAWPARLARDGTLHVNTTSATWAFELTQLAGEIEERLRDALGDGAPAGVRFAAGPVPEVGTSEAAPTTQRAAPIVDPDVAATADAVASAIDDPGLRELVARAARASLSRPSSDRRF